MSSFKDLLGSFKTTTTYATIVKDGSKRNDNSTDNINRTSNSSDYHQRTAIRSSLSSMTTKRDRESQEFVLRTTSRQGDFAVIGHKHGTDKIHQHHYHRFYPRFIERLRTGKEKSAMLEIGIDQSASLELWLEYFPTHHIYGIDIGVSASGGRFEVFMADQSSVSQLQSTLKKIRYPLNLVIDDGSHLPDHQMLTFHELFPAVLDGGIFIIEDLETSYWTKKDIYGYPTRYGYHHPRSAIERFKGLLPLLLSVRRTSDDTEATSNVDTISNVTFGQNCVVFVKSTPKSELISVVTPEDVSIPIAASSERDADDEHVAKRRRNEEPDAIIGTIPDNCTTATAHVAAEITSTSTTQAGAAACSSTFSFGALLGQVGWEAERDFLCPYRGLRAGMVALIGHSYGGWDKYFEHLTVIEIQLPGHGIDERCISRERYSCVKITKASSRSMGEQIVQHLSSEPVYIIVHTISLNSLRHDPVFDWLWFDLVFTERLQGGGVYVIQDCFLGEETFRDLISILLAIVDDINHEYLTEFARQEQDHIFRGELSRRCRESISSITIGRGFAIVLKKTDEQLKDRTYWRPYRFSNRL